MKMMKMAALSGALMVMVTSVQALSLGWGSGWAYSTNPNGSYNSTYYNDGIAGGTAWLLVLSANNVSGISVDNTGTLTVNGSTVQSFTETGWNTSFIGAATSANVIPGNFYAVVVYDPLNQMYGISDVALGTSTGMSFGPPEVGGAAAFGNNSGRPETIGDGYFMEANIQAVPEPTSLALLALGGIAIGLRRKFRKS